MFKLILSRIKHRKKATFSLFIAFIVIFSIIPFSIKSILETKIIVTSTIEQHARGSYDLLIRPKGEKTEVETKLGVVEENYIDDGNGGISIEEWQKIKQDKDIEIAAPVASLGYFSGNQTAVGLPLLQYPARFTWQFYTSDGLNDYLLDEKKSIVYFEGKENEYVDYYAPADTSFGLMGARIPRNYYQLIAIDPHSESAITGIDFSDLLREIEEDSDEEKILENLLSFRGNPPVIPILQNRDLNVSLGMVLSVERLDIQATAYKEKFNLPIDEPFILNDPEIEKEFVNELLSEPVISKEEYKIDLSGVQSPFNGQYVQLKDDFALTAINGGPLSNDTGKYFRTSKIQYKIDGDTLKIPIVKDILPPIYRNIKEQGSSYFEDENVPFMLWQMGSFTVGEQEEYLASSPLGIYGDEPMLTEDGVEMTPTISPGSFISTGAAGLTTMEAARLIKGNEPIDAIRVRISGISEYDMIAKKKIETIATKYLNQGYEVDIVAGSSYKKLEMDVEKVGKVFGQWTTLGIANQITSSIDTLTVLNIILFVVFSLLWLGARLVFEYFGTLDERKSLEYLGVHQKQIQRIYLYEQFVILVSSALLTIIIYRIFNVSAFIYLVFIGLWLLNSLFILVINQVIPKLFRKHKTRIRSGALFYYAKFILPTALVLFVSMLLITLQTTSVFMYLFETNTSRLGEFTVSLTLQLQIILILITIGLTFLSVSEAITLMINQRKVEFQMYSLIGWTKGMIVRQFGKEVILWSSIPILCGLFVSLILLLVLKHSIGIVTVICIVLALLLQLGIIILVKNKKYGLL